MTTYATKEALEAGLAHIKKSPKDEGELRLLVRRPDKGEREVLEEATLDLEEGLVGDNWRTRSSSKTVDGSAHPEMQLTIMNARVIDLLTQDISQWPLAGDQLYLELNLSDDNLPPGTRLALGDAVIEITAVPHTGCKKFRERFGPAAGDFVNSSEGRSLNLRGVNAKIVEPGTISVGQRATKLP